MLYLVKTGTLASLLQHNEMLAFRFRSVSIPISFGFRCPQDTIRLQCEPKPNENGTKTE